MRVRLSKRGKLWIAGSALALLAGGIAVNHDVSVAGDGLIYTSAASIPHQRVALVRPEDLADIRALEGLRDEA